MIKLVIVATNLNRNKFWRRWLCLKNEFGDIDITILAPKRFESGDNEKYTFGYKEVFEGSEYMEERFRVRPIRIKQNPLGGWSSPDIKQFIMEEKPDFVYYIGIHASESLSQVISASKKVRAKVLVFTMRGDLKPQKPATIKHYAISKYVELLNRRNVAGSDAIFVHYPDAVTAFRREGYQGPLFINTQIGVDTSYFRFSEDGRNRIRGKYNLQDCYVFGGASRLNAEKGIIDAISALPVDKKIKYMILGNGTEKEKKAIQACAEHYGVMSQIIMPGMISWDELPDYLSAMDCAIHIPKRTENWVETFSLALVQEMSVGLPIIGSRSGSVPYQIGRDDLLVDEQNTEQVHSKMVWVANNKEQASKIGEEMRKRCVSCFDIEHIAHCFGVVLHELADGIYNTEHIDTAVRWES